MSFLWAIWENVNIHLWQIFSHGQRFYWHASKGESRTCSDDLERNLLQLCFVCAPDWLFKSSASQQMSLNLRVKVFWANVIFSLSECITKLDNEEAKCMVNISIAQDFHRNRTRQNITGVVIQHQCCMITSDEAFTMKWIVSSRSIITFNGAPGITKRNRVFYKL